MKLEFSRKELSAVVKLALTMIMADGRFDENEKALLALEMARFGVKEDDFARLLVTADAMDTAETVSVISNLANNEKKYVAAVLGTLMAVDKDIDEAEMKLWQLTSTICKLPTMNIAQAVEFMANL